MTTPETVTPPEATRPASPVSPAETISDERYSSMMELVRTRARLFLREPEAVFWTFVFPILLATGLGVAFRSRPAERVPVAVVAPAGDTIGAALTRTAKGLTITSMDSAAAAQALRTGDVALVLQSRGKSSSGAALVEYHFDVAREDARNARLLADDAVQRLFGRRDPVGVQERHVTEPGSRYIDFVVPGLLGMNMLGSGVWGIGFSIVESRRRKLLKRFISTPMSRAQYLGSFMVLRLVLLFVEAVVILGFAALAFGVPLRGSLASLAVICVLASLTFSGLGLLIASRARTVEGATGIMNLVMMPMWIASGVFFSAANFPKTVQPFIHALPLTAVNDALRANMLRGAPLASSAGELAVLGVWLVLTFAIALKIFRWT